MVLGTRSKGMELSVQSSAGTQEEGSFQMECRRARSTGNRDGTETERTGTEARGSITNKESYLPKPRIQLGVPGFCIPQLSANLCGTC